MTRVYVSGGTVPDAEALTQGLAAALRAVGAEVVVPAYLAGAGGSWEAQMRRAVPQVAGADAVVMLPCVDGPTRRVRLERDLAQALGLRVVDDLHGLLGLMAHCHQLGTVAAVGDDDDVEDGGVEPGEGMLTDAEAEVGEVFS